MLVGDRPNRIEVDAIRRGEVQVVFGTESLLEESIPWKRLGLVIVESRDLDSLVFPDFSDRTGQTPDVLLVTRSPIPTSLAFTEFGGFDISVVDDVCVELANTEIYTADQRADAYAVARDLVEGGHQAFVVFPGKDGEDLLGPDDALRMAEALQADAFPGKRIGIYCSAMSREERSRVFDDFQRRRIDVLVCTTHIEDAPAVPKASVMMVEYADMYDMTRLHRLRGHVSGGRERGHCAFVLSDSPSTAGKEAVEIAQNEVDGFRLAEVDLSRRGAQAVTGKENTRPLAFRWANPAEDRILLRMARQEALQFVRNDPELKVFPHLAAGIGQLWGDWLGDALPTPQLDRPNRPRRRRRRRRRR